MSQRATTADGHAAGFLATAAPAPAQQPSSQQNASVVLPVKNAKSWSHMVAGAVGSLAAATATAPFDVIRTRLQSDFYQQQQRARAAATAAAAKASRPGAALPAPPSTANPLRAMGRHLGETMQIFAAVQRNEGWRALFKGLGPTLVGTVPAKSINFYTYGNGKRLLAEAAGVSPDTPWVQLGAGIVAGLATSTATNPIWLIKTRLQLDREGPTTAAHAIPAHRRYRNSLDCVRQVVRQEGVRGLYKGMTASYLGAAESTLHWLLYEQLKRGLERRHSAAAAARLPTAWDRFVEWTGPLAAASAAKLCATLLTYPHEVVRTRLRQAPAADGHRKYSGLVQCFLRVWREERIAGLYGGLTPHLLRTVPAAGITFGIYEIVLKLLNAPE